MLQVGVVGVSYKTASLKLRESLAREIDEKMDLNGVFGCPFILLGTCNRFEIYFSGSDLYQLSHKIVSALEMIVNEFGRASFYYYFGHTCFLHLAKVISGLDSAILGESDVQRQVKKAYLFAKQKRSLSKDLHYLFQKSLRIGKLLRTHFFSHNRLMSLERYIFETVKEDIYKGVLFIGYSDINRKLMKEFIHRKVKNIAICTRFGSEDERIVSFDFQQVRRWIDYPVVIVATKYPHYLIREEHAYLKDVKTRYLFDLGIPRNVEPMLAEYEGVGLYDLEVIANEIEKQRKISDLDQKRCEQEIKRLTERYEKIYAERELYKMRLFLHA
ncbi:MAG: hypothetical protein K9M07_00055 [Simkaniaceae bacterium]|nr:hypothetical protein [Simkaniaceae bacterium]